MGETGTFRGAGAVRRRSVRADLHSNNAHAPIGRARVESTGGIVARRKNYGFEKRQRELRKQKKKREKEERRKLIDTPDLEDGRADKDGPFQPGLSDQD